MSDHTIEQKMNKKEAKIARQSALAATACAECVRARGHQFDDSVSFPIVVEDELKDLKATRSSRRSESDTTSSAPKRAARSAPEGER